MKIKHICLFRRRHFGDFWPRLVGYVRYPDIEFEFERSPTDVTVVAGHAATLRCRPPVSFPPANVTWYKDGDLLQLSATTRLFPAEVTSSGDLHFTNVQLDDDGTYVCVATNDLASLARRSSSPAVLTVLGSTTNHRSTYAHWLLYEITLFVWTFS